MNYANDRIRTVLLAGHAGSGKTSLAEAMLYLTKGTDRLGRVEAATPCAITTPSRPAAARLCRWRWRRWSSTA